MKKIDWKRVAEEWGFESVMDMLEAGTFDSVAVAACRNCDYTTEYEPDCTRGWCENCDTNTCVSCLVDAGII